MIVLPILFRLSSCTTKCNSIVPRVLFSAWRFIYFFANNIFPGFRFLTCKKLTENARYSKLEFSSAFAIFFSTWIRVEISAKQLGDVPVVNGRVFLDWILLRPQRFRWAEQAQHNNVVRAVCCTTLEDMVRNDGCKETVRGIDSTYCSCSYAIVKW